MRFQPGNDYGAAYRWKPGQSGNRAGRPRIGASICEWWNRLAEEDEDGKPSFTVAQLHEIANAPDDDPKISAPKRIAARHILDLIEGGKTGRQLLQK